MKKIRCFAVAGLMLVPMVVVSGCWRSPHHQNQSGQSAAKPEIQAQTERATDHLKRGNEFYERGDYDRAIAAYTSVLQISHLDKSTLAEVYQKRGDAYQGRDEYALAIADYTQAIQLQPDNAVAFQNRGWAYYDQKNYDLALADANQAIQLQPNNGKSYQLRSWIYQKQSNYKSAFSDYTRAIKLDADLRRYAVFFGISTQIGALFSKFQPIHPNEGVIQKLFIYTIVKLLSPC